MTDFEHRLKEGLSADDTAFLKDLEDNRGLFTQMASTFQGPMKVWTWFATIITFVVTGLGLYASWHFFHAEEVRSMILWGGGAWAAWTSQVALKQWSWDRMHQLALLRELKKIELRLAALGDRAG